MTATHVALLRGINVGRAKRVPMAGLRSLVEELGHGDVRTLLNSGNVVFSAARTGASPLAAGIEAGLVSRLGVSARVTVLDAAELRTILAENPLGGVADDPSRLLVAVTTTAAELAKLAPLQAEDWSPEVLAVGSRAAYLWLPAGVNESRVQAAMSRALRDAVTARNWSTMTRLEALLG